ncbi:MAG TPA: hypothetical protein ENJ37_02685 [Deltaproteobacteria bacterium]|nr:hypothetical protein [Deltaproteobacteria bacterium]
MDSKKLAQQLRTAMDTEVHGYVYYSALADMVEDPKGRNMFRHLAREEKDHVKVLKAIADSVDEGSAIPSYAEALEKGTGLPIFPEDNELVRRFKADPSDINAVNIAIEAEEKAVDFYFDLLKQAGSPEEKVLLTKLLDMEKSHLKVLRWESESLTKSGFWCGEMEFSVEKESG